MTTHGIKVSESGYDVRTTDDLHLLLKSDFTLLKVFASGTTSVTGIGTLTIAHSLGYVPQFLVFTAYSSGSSRSVLSTGQIPGLFSADGTVSYSDSTNLYVTHYENATVKYFIFYEQT